LSNITFCGIFGFMIRECVSGLVLTHADRDPSLAIRQISELAGQIVVVQDTRDEASFNIEDLQGGVHTGCDVVVVSRRFDNFPNQRNAGIDATSGEWVLSVDSDESLAPDLQDELKVLEPESGIDIYAFRKYEHLTGRRLRVANFYGGLAAYHPRLFRSTLLYAEQPRVHEEFIDQQDLTIRQLEGHLMHEPDETVIQLIAKAFRYGIEGGSEPKTGHNSFNYAKLAHHLAQFVISDKIPGLAVASMQIAYGLGVKSSRYVH
jgi:glycosyltransferase involved in cell wall biosynthesis